MSNIFKRSPTLENYKSIIEWAECNYKEVKVIKKNKNKINEPIITIITVVFNGVNTITKTIESVINQTYENIEYIIIDGMSTDGTAELVNLYSNKISLFISESDNGIADGMNKGVVTSKGDILCFLNSGDYFVNNRVIEDVANSFIKHNWLWAYGQAKLLLDFRETRFSQARTKYKSWKNYYMTPNCHQATFIHRELFNKLGLYSIGNDKYFDVDFFIRVASYIQPYELNRYIVWYDITGLSSIIQYKALVDRVKLTLHYCNLWHAPLWILLICIRWFKSLTGYFAKKIIRIVL